MTHEELANLTDALSDGLAAFAARLRTPGPRADIYALIQTLIEGQMKMEPLVQELVDRVTGLTSVTDGVIATIDGLKEQLEAAKDDPVALQAAIDSLDANRDRLTAAITDNTPVEGELPTEDTETDNVADDDATDPVDPQEPTDPLA